MTTSNEHNNAPAVQQGEPVAWMVYGNYTRQPFGMLSSAEAYMRGLLKSDPDGGYHIRPLRYATPASAPAQYKDSTPQLSVGESSFESWFESYNPANKGDKQRSRDAYAAGMGDPLVAAAPAQDEPFGHFRVEPFGWTDCAKDDEGAIALYERPQEVGLTDEALDNLIEDLSEWSRHVVEDTAHQTLEAHVREVLAKNPIIAALRAKGGKHV